MEEFRKIEGFENYSVSNHGNVRNDETGRILKSASRACYPAICLWLNGNQYFKYVHRLVAQTFCENENNNNQVDHIDGNKCNNHYLNLRWVNNSQNLRNRKKYKSSSTYLGVSFNNHAKKWKSNIRLNGKVKYLGYYDTEELAHQAFCKAVYDNNLVEFYPPNELHFTN